MRTSSRPVAPSAPSAPTARQPRLRIVPRTRGEHEDADYNDLDTQSLADEGDVIAGILPVPPSIEPSMRAVLHRAILLRFPYAEDLDAWANAPNERLDDDAPFARLLDGDGIGVLRALLAVPINPDCANGNGISERDADDERGSPPLRLVG